MVDAMARHCLRVSKNWLPREGADEHGPLANQVPLSWIRDGLESLRVYDSVPREMQSVVRMPYERWDYPVEAALEVRVGSKVLPLTEMGGVENVLSQSRTGWRIGRVQIWLNGRLIDDRPRRPALRSNAAVRIILGRTLPADQLVGKHTFKCRVQLVAPNELATTVQKEYTLEVVQDEFPD
jgi:hypothetical protein